MRHSFFGMALLVYAGCLAYSQAPSWNQVSLTPPVFEYWSGSGSLQPPLGLQPPNSASTAYPLHMYYPTGVSPSGTVDPYGCQFRGSLSPTTGSIGSAPNAYPPEYPEWATGSSFNSNTELAGKPIPRAGISQVGVGYEAPSGSTAIKGISMEATFPGGAQATGSPTMNFFWESDNCADGDTEYGFTLVPVNGSQITQFYYSYWSNCGDPAIDPSYADSCWAIGYATSVGLLVVDSVVQCTGAVNMPVSTSPSSTYYYNAFPYLNGSSGHWDFMAQVMNSAGSLLESCIVDPTNGANTSCSPTPVASNEVVTNVTKYGTCEINPATSTTEFNTTTFFNPQWVYGVGGWVFAVLNGSSGSPYLNNAAPVTISSIRVGE